jgi:hypothetical protein
LSKSTALERDEMIEAARTYDRNKAGAMSIRAAFVVGSVARDDFNPGCCCVQEAGIVGGAMPQRGKLSLERGRGRLKPRRTVDR